VLSLRSPAQLKSTIYVVVIHAGVTVNSSSSAAIYAAGAVIDIHAARAAIDIHAAGAAIDIHAAGAAIGNNCLI